MAHVLLSQEFNELAAALSHPMFTLERFSFPIFVLKNIFKVHRK